MKKRLYNLSYLRVATMMIVVWYHCIIGYSDVWEGSRYAADVIPFWNEMTRYIASFHMPVFAILSGYLYAYKRPGGVF